MFFKSYEKKWPEKRQRLNLFLKLGKIYPRVVKLSYYGTCIMFATFVSKISLYMRNSVLGVV